MKRAAPALALLLLAPWVGEFLLGNISVRRLPALLIAHALARAARRQIRAVIEQPRSKGTLAPL